MRCAIRRLVSRGKSLDRPPAVRDSEAIQATTPLEAWDHPLPQASKTSGQKVEPRAATMDAVSWKARLRVSTSCKNISHRRGGRGEVGGAEQRRDREISRRQRGRTRLWGPRRQRGGDRQQSGKRAREGS